MREKKIKNGGRKKLVNIISQLAKERLSKSSEDGILESKEENVVMNVKEIEADDNNVVPVEHSPLESRRKSKRKPEKTVKSTCEPVAFEESEHQEKSINEPGQVTTKIPDSNLTIVVAVPSDDDFNEMSEGEKENENDKKAKKKKTHKPEVDSKEKTDANLRVVHCTACNKNIQTKSGKFCRHPDLNTIICKECYKFFCSGKFTRDEYGVEEFCRWCADGGQLICCDFCEKAFCKKCIKRNLGKSKLKELLEADENEKWSCFCCDPAPISSIIKLCNRVMRMLDLEKDQHTLYKNKKGREIIPGPNRSERRNLLINLSGEQTIKNEKLSPKKTYSKSFQNGISSSSEDKEKTSDDEIEEVNRKKTKTKINLSVEEGDNSNEQSENDERLKSKTKEKRANKSTKKRNDKIDSSDSDSRQRYDRKKKNNYKDSRSSEEKPKRSKKVNKSVKKPPEKSKSKNERIDSGPGKKKVSSDELSDEAESSEDVSSDSVIKRKKKNYSKRSGKDVGQSLDSESDVKESSKKRKKKNNKSKARKDVSQSSDSESDFEDSSKKRQKKNNKNKARKYVSQSSDSESDVEDSSKKRKKTNNKKKARNVGKWSLRRKHDASSGSDKFDSDEEDVKKRKCKRKGDKKTKSKLKRKRKEDVDEEESDDEDGSPSKKGRKKIRKILDNDKLAEATRHARQLEEERRQRLLERTKSTVFEKPDRVDIKEVVLEYKSDGKTPLVEVQVDLVKHLKPHQVEGLKFMYDCTIESVERWKNKEEGGGCILAHVMGLGKTLQVVSLVHTLYQSDLVELRRVLVVCPLNTVLNWQVEFEKWLSVDDRLNLYVLNEVSGNWKRVDMLKSWMNYGGVLIMGYSMYRNLSQCSRVRNKRQKKIFKECLVDPGPELVVCDEGHVLRNFKSAISVAMNAIKTKRRIVLTGTPLQNNLVEYHCMVSFVKPNLLGTLKEFSNSFIRPIQNGQCADSTVMDVKLMKRRCHVLHKMLAGCVQRKDYGEIARFLPPKFEYVIKVRLSAKQREMYKYYLNTFLEESKGKGGSLFSDYQALMRIWTHPWSLKLETARKIEDFIDSDDSLKDFVVYSDEEEESAVSSEEMSWTSDSSSDKGKGKRGKKRSKSTSDESDDDESDDDESEPEMTKSKSKRSTRKQSVEKEFIADVKVDPDEPSTSSFVVLDNSDDELLEVKPNVNEKIAKEGNGITMVTSTLRSGQEFKDPTEVIEEQEWYDQFLKQEDENNIELGSKIVLLLEILADAAALEEKVLVFSHSLISLDVIEMALGGGEIGGNAEDWCRGCDYFRMDGSTSAQMRKRWADIFNDGENKAARLFLISTKAGGLGINLVGASRVVVFDVSWNPSHDVQSIFRAYRFGQNKPVFIYRFIAEGTMEEKIYDRQVTKLSMAQRVVDEHQIQRHFNASDLAELYRFEPDVLENENDERPTPAVPKDAVLAELVNRLYPKWIVKYHEHDSLLQNRPEEELTEAERKEAWEHWELEKQGILNAPQVTAEQVQQRVNGVRMPNTSVIGIPGTNSGVRNQFTFGGPRVQVPPPQNAPTFAGIQRPPNYQQVVLEEQRRRLFEMERRRVQEAQQRAQEQMRLLHQRQQRQRREEEERKRANERLRAELDRQRVEADRQRAEKIRQNAERLRAEEQRRQRQQQQPQGQQQQQPQGQQQRVQVDRSYLEQLLRGRNAYVTQPQSGNPNQQVFQIVMDNNSTGNATRPQRQNRSPPRIIELPPDA